MSASRALTNLADMVRHRAKAFGDAVAYEFEGRQTSFAEFDRNTNRVANALKALGVRPRERVCYLVARRWDRIECNNKHRWSPPPCAIAH
jgi:acyl-CoA synthetase (AMP-forming)/AMP-acid ligase II